MDAYISELLYLAEDLDYKQFHAKLIPDISQERIIGVRIPEIRKIAKRLIMENKSNVFIKELPHFFYEENNLHAFIISEIKDYNLLIKELDRFLEYVDNWATCDSLRPKVFSKNKERLISDVYRWLKKTDEYTVRFAVEVLMVHFLDEDFDVTFLDTVADINSDKYYVNMMKAWYFATALAKQWDSSVVFLETGKLDDFVHNKTIQKAIESCRISDDKKAYLKTLRRKSGE